MNVETKETKWIFCIVTLITFSSDIFAENAKRPYRKGTRRQIPSFLLRFRSILFRPPCLIAPNYNVLGEQNRSKKDLILYKEPTNIRRPSLKLAVGFIINQLAGLRVCWVTDGGRGSNF